MALTPDPRWAVPAKTWPEIVNRYIHFRRVKTWRGRTHATDGTINPNRLTKAQADRLKHRLTARVESLVEKRVLPKRAHPPRQKVIDKLLKHQGCARHFDRAPQWVKHLWRAAILNRDRYTCRYCYRTALSAHRQLGATLRFELDHRRAKARLGKRRDDFRLGNIDTACRSCNGIKGQMTHHAFLKELRSLAAAVDKERRQRLPR